MIYQYIALSALFASVNAQCDFAFGCMADAECTTFGAGIPCTPDPTNVPMGCCLVPTTTTTTTTAATTAASSTTNATCVDLLNPLTGVSDCPARSSLCTNSVYLDVMRVQCPRTCNLCSNSTTTNSTSCIDLTNAATGVSDCPGMKSYCNNTIYNALMRVQCPATCGFCTSG